MKYSSSQIEKNGIVKILRWGRENAPNRRESGALTGRERGWYKQLQDSNKNDCGWLEVFDKQVMIFVTMVWM